MKKSFREGERDKPGYPHVLSRVGGRRNDRWRVQVSNEHIVAPREPWLVVGPGMSDRTGAPTALGRASLIRQVGERAIISKARYCIAWGPNECTYFAPDGAPTHGTASPIGNLIVEDTSPETCPIDCEAVWSVPIRGEAGAHLCIKRSGDLVEVILGSPVILADFSNLPDDPKNDPTSKLRHRDGRWISPLVYRGQPVTSVRDDWVLLGPVQPLSDARAIVLHAPWPEELNAACNSAAGYVLPKEILTQAWQAAEKVLEAIELPRLLAAA